MPLTASAVVGLAMSAASSPICVTDPSFTYCTPDGGVLVDKVVGIAGGVVGTVENIIDSLPPPPDPGSVIDAIEDVVDDLPPPPDTGDIVDEAEDAVDTVENVVDDLPPPPGTGDVTDEVEDTIEMTEDVIEDLPPPPDSNDLVDDVEEALGDLPGAEDLPPAPSGLPAAPSSSSSQSVTQVAPRPTTSRYMHTVDPGTAYAEGCMQADDREIGLVLLDFAGPRYVNGVWGTALFTQNGFYPNSSIENSVKQFIRGHYECLAGNVENFFSDSRPELIVAIGTNNSTGSHVSYAAGEAWGQLVNHVYDWADDYGYLGWFLSDVRAANDMEMGYNTYERTKSWLDGYGATAAHLLYNFGDAAGCPSLGPQTSLPRGCSNGWDQREVWWVSWGNPRSLALPEIYRVDGNMAKQWYYIKLYSVRTNQIMHFSGALTQWLACRERECGQAQAPSNRFDNRPETGWSQLHDELNVKTVDDRTRQELAYSSDITHNPGWTITRIGGSGPSRSCAGRQDWSCVFIVD